MSSIVSLSVFLPLAGSLLLLALPRASSAVAHRVAIATSVTTLLATMVMWVRGVVPGGFAQVEESGWIQSIGAAYRVGVDGFSLPLIVLTALLFLLSILHQARSADRPRSFAILMLMLETASIGTFAALDGLLFYVFFEVSLVSMYFMIAGWGEEDRRRAALMFFLYTFLGSLPLLLAILGFFAASGTFDMRVWIEVHPLTGPAAMLALIATLFTFAVKTPVFPLHTWLPAAHVQAPTVGSVILAGVMLKFGTYGLVRFSLQMLPETFRDAGLAILGVGVVSALYGAFVALAQRDLKRLIAYTSINHMGYVVIGVAVASRAATPAMRAVALDGATLQMVSHGLVTGALFFLVGMLKDRAHTRLMDSFGGLLKITPTLGWTFIFFAFASLGLPGLAHFPAEFQIFLATLNVQPVAIIAIIAIVVTAGLYLRAISVVFLGEPREEWVRLSDLHRLDALVLVPLLLLTIAIGVMPSWVLNVIHTTTAALGL